jgi:hypothetical protein
LLLALVSAVILGSKFRGTHILLPQIQPPPQLGGPAPRICIPRNRMAQL